MKKKTTNKAIKFFMWLVGVAVVLSLGFALIGETLVLPSWLGGPLSSVIVGWIVLISTALSVLFKIIHKLL